MYNRQTTKIPILDNLTFLGCLELTYLIQRLKECLMRITM